MADPSDSAPEKAVEEVFYPADDVPFVDWSHFSGAKPAVYMTGVVTLLAFVTGLSTLSQPTVPLDGPLAAFLPYGKGLVRFAGVLFAFLLAPVTFGLRRGKELAWQVAMVLLPALALLPFITFQTTDIPLLFGILVAIPLLVRNRDQFDQPLDLSPLQIASLLSVVGVVVYGTVGAYALRGVHFPNIEDAADAFYFVIITIATVGYGDITPETRVGEFFSISIVLFGTGAFTAAVGSLVVPAIESRMASAFGNMTPSELALLEDHVVVLGYGELTESLLEELGETSVVVVTPDPDVASDLAAEDINVLTADPTDESVMEDASVDTARGVVVGGDDDARNVLSVIAAKSVNPEVRIVAAANEEKHVDKLRSVGADEVINPRTLGGRLLGRTVLDRDAPESIADVLEDDEE